MSDLISVRLRGCSHVVTAPSADAWQPGGRFGEPAPVALEHLPPLWRHCVGAARLCALARLRRRSASSRFPPPTQWRQTGGQRQGNHPRRSRAQLQQGAPGVASSPATPCGRGVGVIAPRRRLGGATPPPYRTRGTRGSGTNAARCSKSSTGERVIPVVPSDQGVVKV
jgi:hypothetical protein